VTFRCSLSLAQQPIVFCLGTSLPATCRLFGFSFLFRHFSSLPPLSVCKFLFRAGLPTRCGACLGDVTIAVAYCKAPCTIHIGCGFVEVWRGPVCLAVLDQCFPWEVIIEPVKLHAASLNCTVQCGVESTQDQSCVSRCCVVSGRGTSTEKSHGRYLAKFDSFQCSVDSSKLSVFWRFALSFRLWLLWSLHSGSRWPSLWYATSLQPTLFSRASTRSVQKIALQCHLKF